MIIDEYRKLKSLRDGIDSATMDDILTYKKYLKMVINGHPTLVKNEVKGYIQDEMDDLKVQVLSELQALIDEVNA